MSDRERWIAWVRLGAVAFAAAEIAVFTPDLPAGHAVWAWALTGVFAVGAAAIAWVARGDEPRRPRALSFAALVFDTAVVVGYALVFAYEYGGQTRWALYLVVVEAALRYELRGAVVYALAIAPVLAGLEWWRADRFAPPPFHIDRVTFPAGLMLLSGLIVGWLVANLHRRAAEAERLRDELGRRVDVLDATSRCARALASSLELDHAFAAFIRELRGLVPFERTAILLVEERGARVMATAGRGATDVFGPGTTIQVANSILTRVVQEGETVYRPDMEEQRYPEEETLVGLGLRSRVLAPLQVGARPIGALSVVRAEPDAFGEEEVELITLLGRLVGTAVQNIRMYEAERTTVDELRRLSALRADFVSLVSHELRSPMAAVIGSARTLQHRWRELRPEQRDAFLAVIGDETNRLSALIGDVLDTSRLEAGTFDYTFTDVDLSEVVRDAVAAAGLAQDEVEIRPQIPPTLPRIRGDRERLRQALDNLISNALKYSGAGEAIDVVASAENGEVKVEVSDRGPGIAPEHHTLIFEKFGRVGAGGGSKPGTGLGLFIARSFAEAHGGSVRVWSAPGEGATFTLSLPAER